MITEPDEHLSALRRWIEQKGSIPKQSPGITGEERKQLQAVNKTIEQLNKLGVSIPEDLRNLKLRLSAKDISGIANPEIEQHITEIDGFIDQVRELLQKAQSIKNRLKTTGPTSGSKKHYGIKMIELLQSGYLSTEDRLELQWVKDGTAYEGKIQTDGSVIVKTDGGWKPYKSLSTAASDIAGRSLNGWEVWRRINNDGTRTPLLEIRSRYMTEGTK